MAKKILITGFEPFGEQTVNPCELIVNQLNGELLTNGQIVGCVLPVVGCEAIEKAIAAIDSIQPDVVIALGLAVGRDSITPEKVAINFDDFPIPDNKRNQFIDRCVVESGPSAYFSTLPIKAIVESLQDKKIPANISFTAGTYVCNHLFYGLMHYLKDSPIRCGFIHIPLMHEESTKKTKGSMLFSDLVKAIRISADISLTFNEDSGKSQGTIC